VKLLKQAMPCKQSEENFTSNVTINPKKIYQIKKSYLRGGKDLEETKVETGRNSTRNKKNNIILHAQDQKAATYYPSPSQTG